MTQKYGYANLEKFYKGVTVNASIISWSGLTGMEEYKELLILGKLQNGMLLSSALTYSLMTYYIKLS